MKITKKLKNIFKKKPTIKATHKFWDRLFGGESVPGTLGDAGRVFSKYSGVDYWRLRHISNTFFIENHYAKAAISRLVKGVVGKGLNLKYLPRVGKILGEDILKEKMEDVENKFDLWSLSKMSDYTRTTNFYLMQSRVYQESLIEGDVLVLLRINKGGLPSIQLYSGRDVCGDAFTSKALKDTHRILNGVEVDEKGMVVAYHVRVVNNKNLIEFQRIAAFGNNSNRRVSFLVFGEIPRIGEYRGTPFLSRVLESMGQIKTFATYELEAAKINASLSAWIEKTAERAGSNPYGSVGEKNEDDLINQERNIGRLAPGMVFNELAFGEKPHSFDTKRPNANFGVFKENILNDISFACDIPPEILKMSFNSNYSASRQAVIEFGDVVKIERKNFQDQFLSTVFREWLKFSVLNGDVVIKDYLKVLLFENNFYLKKSFEHHIFVGDIKENVDIKKEMDANKIKVEEGLETRESVAKRVNGSDFNKNIKKLTEENNLLSKANESLLGDITTSKNLSTNFEENAEGVINNE